MVEAAGTGMMWTMLRSKKPDDREQVRERIAFRLNNVLELNQEEGHQTVGQPRGGFDKNYARSP